MQKDEIPVGKTRDLRGQKFNRLTPLYRVENKNHNVCWKCMCDCGNYSVVNSYALVNGRIKSCGCLQREKISQLNKKN